MKSGRLKHTALVGLLAAVVLLPTPAPVLRAQPAWPYGPPPMMPAPQTPSAQRNAMNSVRAQVGWLQNATRTAASYGAAGAGNVSQQFQVLRGAYTAFTVTLTPQQLAVGANELAELSGGLDILAEAFTNYQDDLAAGRNANTALSDMCQVLRQAAGVWQQEFDRDCARLRVGW